MVGILSPRPYSLLGGTPIAPTPMQFTPPTPLNPPSMTSGAPDLQNRPFLNWLAQNSDALAGMSAGLLGGETTSDAFGRGFAGFAEGRRVGDERRRKEREDTERQQRLKAVSDWAQSRVKAGAFTDADARLVSAYPELAGQFMRPNATERWEPAEIGGLSGQRNATTGEFKPFPGQTAGGGFRPLVDPNERAQYGIPPQDTRPYQVGPNGELKAVGGNSVTVNNQVGADGKLGQVPPGYIAVPDESNPAGVRMVPVPGSPAAAEAGRQADAAASAQNQRTQQSGIVTQDVDRALQIIEETGGWGTTGLTGSIASQIAGTRGHDLAALVDTIKANATIDKLQAMRAASPTGAALGNVTERENQMLADAIGNLSVSQSMDQLVANLKRVRDLYRQIVDGPGAGQAAPQVERWGRDANGNLVRQQ